MVIEKDKSAMKKKTSSDEKQEVDKLQRLFNDVLEFTNKRCNEHNALAVAAVMMVQALGIYKSELDNEDYNRMIDNMSVTSDSIRAFEKRSLQ